MEAGKTNKSLYLGKQVKTKKKDVIEINNKSFFFFSFYSSSFLCALVYPKTRKNESDKVRCGQAMSYSPFNFQNSCVIVPSPLLNAKSHESVEHLVLWDH